VYWRISTGILLVRRLFVLRGGAHYIVRRESKLKRESEESHMSLITGKKHSKIWSSMGFRAVCCDYKQFKSECTKVAVGVAAPS